MKLPCLAISAALLFAAPAIAEDIATIIVHGAKITVEMKGPKQETYCEASKLRDQWRGSMDVPNGTYKACDDSSPTSGLITAPSCCNNCLSSVPATGNAITIK